MLTPAVRAESRFKTLRGATAHIRPFAARDGAERGLAACSVSHRLRTQVRPTVKHGDWGYDIEMLRIAGLARYVQMRMGYLHSYTPAPGLKVTCHHAPPRAKIRTRALRLVFGLMRTPASPGRTTA